MKRNKVIIKNRRGKNLVGYLDSPDNIPILGYGIFCHCFTCNKQYKLILNINKELIKLGFAILRFDFTGLGESDGKFSETSFSTNVEDIIDVSNYLEKNFKSPSFLIGHSLGGVASIKASHYIKSIKAISTIGSPYDLNNLINLFSKYKEELYKKGEATINISGRPFKIKKDFLLDLKNQDTKTFIKTLNVPILIFHAISDEIVNFNQGINIFNTAPNPKGFISLDNGDHLVTNKEDAKYIGTMIGNWLIKHIIKASL